MPKVAEGPLRGFYLPDYDGGSIVNLLSSIIRSRGGRSPHRELIGLPARELRRADKLVYLLIDGIGEAQLQAFLGRGHGRAFFSQHDRRVISTVFPATTAAAVTTLGTGASPAEHAILGWYLHLHDLGLVSVILPGTTRTQVAMTPPQFDLDAYLKLPSYLGSTTVRRELVTPSRIVNSRFSRLGAPWQQRRAYRKLQGMEGHIVSFAKGRGRGLAYAYWPRYDGYCHELGCEHAMTQAHLAELDLMLSRLVRRLRGTDTLLLVLADHGLVDSTARQRIDLKEIEGFYDCLAMLPSGDMRAVSCFVRPARVKRFLSLVQRHLSAACVCLSGEELIDSGALGPGKEHPALRNRVGDYVLLAKRSYAFISTLPGSSPVFSVGNHGGMSKAEVLVPLYAVRS